MNCALAAITGASRTKLIILALALHSCDVTWASSLVGPGAVGSFQGGGGGRRHGGFVQVNDPPVGFFVGGSNIREMNGLYSRVQHTPDGTSHEFTFAYSQEYTGWTMALVQAPEDVQASTGKKTEWMFIDTSKVDRFRHDGDQLIPGSGERWSHIHRTKNAEPDPSAGTAVAAAEEDDIEELPWQIIGVGGEQMMENLKAHFRFYKHEVQMAIGGANLPAKPEGGVGLETAPPADFTPPAPVLAASEGEAAGRDICAESGSDIASAESALESVKTSANHWAEATLHLHIAVCERKARRFQEAGAAVKAALGMFPRYAAALEERGKLLLDQLRYSAAIKAFETALNVDRARPSIATWLVRAHALERRAKSSGQEEKPGIVDARTEHCLAWRQTGSCSPNGAREADKDETCNHPIVGGRSGFCHCRFPGAGVLATAGERTCSDFAEVTCAEECRKRAEALQSVGLSEEAKVLAAEVAKAAEADPCSLPSEEGAPEWCQTNYYAVLAVRCDFALHAPVQNDEDSGQESEELKRVYKRRSLQFHPDKRGGSAAAFQRVAEANQVLSDSKKRQSYDEGEDFGRKVQHDGALGATHREEIEKKYFPDRFGFEPFGDPHSDRREHADRKQKMIETQRQAALAQEAAQKAQLEGRTEEL